MKLVKICLLLQLFSNSLIIIKAQYCNSLKPVVKTRVQWINGERLISKRNFFGVIKYKYEPYIYSVVQNYYDYDRVTVCCDGYTQVNGDKCEPVCSPECPSNTHCIRPNICECNWGYRGLTTSALSIQCEPFCKPDCDRNAACIEPNKCQCRMGYKEVNGTNTSVSCQPICENGCAENAACTEPGLCTCIQGYFNNSLGQCLPQCHSRCPENSDCTKPDTCTCHANYVAEDGQCKPVCEQTCPQNAVCARPNGCECLPGYETVEVEETNSFSCRAKCVEACPSFASCTEPNKCECMHGYNKTEQNICEPICNVSCPAQGTCIAPNVCACEKGYKLLGELCQPVCENTCPEHATCTEPNKCVCANGYQLKLTSIYNLYCEPVCQNNCSAFGKCVQPNKCECLEGYSMDEFDACQPVCSKGCKGGFCFQPEICVCQPGYLMGPRDECEPVCSMACQNGSCVEPEICQCHEGYELLANSINQCEPKCEPECINGICVAPNVCICRENFEPQQTENGLNHSNCQKMQRTTTTEVTTLTSIETSGARNFSVTTAATSTPALSQQSPSTLMNTFHFELLQHISLAAGPSCNALCQCWKEDDELGDLTLQPCAHLCTDDVDQPCLDLNLCKCDAGTKQLACMMDDKEQSSEDDLVYYSCSLPRLQVTTLRPSEEEDIKSDMKSVKPKEESRFAWWWLVVLGCLIVICLVGLVGYFYCKKPENPTIEYEL